MNVQYKGRQTVNSFGDKLVRPLKPAAIISFTEEEEDKVVAILEETGYDFDIFGEPGFLWAEVAVDGKEDYKDFMKEWKAGKEAYNLRKAIRSRSAASCSDTISTIRWSSTSSRLMRKPSTRRLSGSKSTALNCTAWEQTATLFSHPPG